MAAYAGRYSEDLQDRYGNGYRNALVAVQTLAAAPVTLYADRVKTAYVPAAGLAANEIKADSRGNLIFFADPGNYQIVVTPSGGSTLAAFPISVLPDPLEPDSSAGDLAAHEADTANPHAVTKAQVGLSNVDNTSDVNKPVSTAQQTALDLKANATDLTTEITNRQNADTAHVAAVDPHGDRAYADAGLAGKASTSDPRFLFHTFKSGFYYMPPCDMVNTATVMTANGMTWATPIKLPGGLGIDRLGIQVTTAGSTGALLRFMIYGEAAAGGPGALLVDGGTVNAESLGVKEVTISWTVPASGTYFPMVVCQGAPTTRPAVYHYKPLLVSGTVSALNIGDFGTYRDNAASITGTPPANWPTGVSITSDRRAPVPFFRVA